MLKPIVEPLKIMDEANANAGPPTPRASGLEAEFGATSSQGPVVELAGYRLIRLAGRGGMGEVFEAEDPRLDRRVAIKTMRRELMNDEASVARFIREARAVARLNHPNIVQIFQIGEERGLLFFVMEWVDGETVSQLLKRAGVLDPDKALDILEQAAAGLGYAHGNGVIHRDIKPGNLMLDRAGRVKIADFGLAKMLESDAQMTVSGTSLGSPSYMSPEQARGEAVDHRSDIYSLGITLYQMVAGQLPHTATTPMSVMMKHVQDPLPEPPALQSLRGGSVLALIKRITEKNPADRCPNYDEIRALAGAIRRGANSPAEMLQAAGLVTASTLTAWNPALTQASATMAATVAAAGHRRSLSLVLVVVLVLGAMLGGAVITAGLVRSHQPRTADAAPTPFPAPAAESPSPVPGPPSRADGMPAPEGFMPGGPGGRFDREAPPRPLRDALRRTRPGFQAVVRSPEVERMRLAYDFQGIVAYIDRLMKEPTLTVDKRVQLGLAQDTFRQLAAFRLSVVQASAARRGEIVLERSDTGKMTLTGADDRQFTFRDARGQERYLLWQQLSPTDVLTIAGQALRGQDNQRVFEEFLRVYPQQTKPPGE